MAQLAGARDAARERRAGLEQALASSRAALDDAERDAERTRSIARDAESELERARREAAATGAELATANQFLRSASASLGGAVSLGQELSVEPGYELAVAAVLGPRLRAGVVDDLYSAERLLDSVGGGASALVARRVRADAGPRRSAPTHDASPLLERVRAGGAVSDVAARLLADVWVVPTLAAVPPDFAGVAVTIEGRALFGASGEIRQALPEGERELLAQRNRRDSLIAASERAAGAEADARAALDEAHAAIGAAYAARDAADAGVRTARRALDEVDEEIRRSEWLIERRRAAPDDGPDAVRAAELRAELRAERRLAEQAERERADRRRRLEWLRARIARDTEVVAAAERAANVLDSAGAAVTERAGQLAAELEAAAADADRTSTELQACAREEAELQRRLHAAGDAVTEAEVRAQRLRDATAEARAELRSVCGRLGQAVPGDDAVRDREPLAEDRRGELDAKVVRLERRREALGPVNPLAKDEYEQAVAHVEDLERQRQDLESALAELERLIRDTDREIRRAFEETFETAARNFEETVAHLFPGGRGRLRLVKPDGPRPVLGGEEPPPAADERPAEDAPPADEAPGVEIEVTPAGKATKRLSLMSGGEKSLVALAFLFAVFLARPCPFYILDEVEAALDDANIDRFLELVRRFSDRAQFIVVTHQKRTMDAADCLYGVSMGGDGVSKVISRRLPAGAGIDEVAAEGDRAAA